MLIRYSVETGTLKAHNMGRYVDWERNGDGGDVLETREGAERLFAELRDDMPRWFRVELNCSPSASMMKDRGCFVELCRAEYENEEDLEDGNPASCETLDYAQYTYDDYAAEGEAE